MFVSTKLLMNYNLVRSHNIFSQTPHSSTLLPETRRRSCWRARISTLRGGSPTSSSWGKRPGPRSCSNWWTKTGMDTSPKTSVFHSTSFSVNFVDLNSIQRKILDLLFCILQIKRISISRSSKKFAKISARTRCSEALWNVVSEWKCFQIEATFRKFDQTGNDKLNLKEFSDMMSKRTDAAKKKSETLNKVVEDKRWSSFKSSFAS